MRARNIKPGFFANEYLAELDPHARLLFIGLWTLADRCGRLEDRPKRIKAEVLPYEDVDVDALLNALANSPQRFIARYCVAGEAYIQITNFAKHQNPHKNETASSIPPMQLHGGDASTVVSTTKDGTAPADSLLLIPDSGYLIPDSPSPDSSKPVAAYCADQGIPLTPTHCQEIVEFYEQGVTDDMMCFAIDEAVGANARSWKYAKAIITRWIVDGIKTLDEAKNAQIAFKAKRGDNNGRPNAAHGRSSDRLGDDKPDLLGSWDIAGRTIV